MKNTVLLIILLGFKGLTFAQHPFQNKCSPAVVMRETDTASENYTLVVSDLQVFSEWATAQKLEIIDKYRPANIIILRTTYHDLAAKILHRPDVLFVDKAEVTPSEELPVPGHNLFVNRINVAHAIFPNLNGFPITVSVKENRFDTSDVDLKNRAALAANAAQQITSHANIMATLIGGAGNSDAAGRGVATGVRLLSNGFNNLLPEDDYVAMNISVQNHAYGLDVENYYGAGAMAYDKSVEANPSLLHVFSAGNKGVDSSDTGIYANISGFANLTGNFKMAKNVLTVGAVDSFGGVAPYSSRGPAYDGRVKPDLTAYGANGTSESAALVSGAGAVLQQAFLKKMDSLPATSLLRAILLNSADDIASPGPDFFSGFGNMNLKNALQTVESHRFETGEVAVGETLSIPLDLPPDVAQLKITLSWDDLPATPNTPKALLNDLDLKVIAPDGSEWLPWSLNAFPHPDSLRLDARRRRDTLNNVEQVTLDFPKSGQYTILVAGSAMKSVSQYFSLCWDWKPLDDFTWNFPVKNDPAVAGRDVLLRWENTFADTTGVLEYRISGGTGWYTVNQAVDLRNGWYRWLVPDTFAGAQVRMFIGGEMFVSDTFLISKELRMEIGFNCPDSVFLFWNAAAPDATYLLSGLGEKYLEPLQVLTDTFVVFQKVDFPQMRFGVTPTGEGGVVGLQSPAPDIREQGVECYFENFLAELNGAFQTDLRLRIGTNYGVKSVSFEKLKHGAFVALEIWQPVDSEVFTFIDESPQQGANRYRARLGLLNGATLFSDTATVYFWGNDDLLVFPNPTYQSSINAVVNTTLDASFVLFDILGRLILEEVVDDIPKTITLPPGLPKGCYPFFLRENGQLKSGGILLFGF